jgi:hypothetical protein
MKTKRFNYQTSLIKDSHHDKKSTALSAILAWFSASEKLRIINKDLDASFVLKPSYEKTERTKNTMNDIGLSYGSWNIIQFGSSPIYPATVLPSSSESKTIGWDNLQPNQKTCARSNIWPLTAHTSIRMVA